MANSFDTQGSIDQIFNSDVLGTNKAPPGFSKSDIITRLSGGFTYDATIGRQDLSMAITGGTEQHVSNSVLSGNFYDASSALKWTTPTTCHGLSALEAQSRQSDLGNQNVPVSNLVSVQSFNNQGSCLLNQSYRLALEADYSQSSNSAAIERSTDRNETHTIASFSYVTPRPAAAGVEMGYTLRDYPNRAGAATSLATQVQEYDAGTLLEYTVSPKTSFSLHAGFAQINASAVTGATSATYPSIDADIKWQPTAKTQVVFVGSEKVVGTDTLNSSYAQTRSFTLTVNNAASQKTLVSLLASYIQRDLFGSASSFGLTTDRSDTISSVTAGVDYKITTRFTFGASAGYVHQTSNYRPGNYDAEIMTLGLKLQY